MNYIGHPLQIRGAEQVVLQGGKGDGMHFLIVRNGLGLECWISLDRCADLTRVTYKGNNMGYLSPCGNVAPQYYDKEKDGFLKSFTAGFFTTAGLTAVGSPCTDEGEELPLHGTISNTPAQLCGIDETEEGIIIRLKISDESLFGRKLVMERSYIVSYLENTFEVRDAVTNRGDETSPYMILYHCNMGYPLLGEKCQLTIPHERVWATTPQAKANMDTARQMEAPQDRYEERCYFYDISDPRVDLYNPAIGIGMTMTYNKDELPCFTEWKMMGKHDYVLGLEPGNVIPQGRDKTRADGVLPTVAPDGKVHTTLQFAFYTK